MFARVTRKDLVDQRPSVDRDLTIEAIGHRLVAQPRKINRSHLAKTMRRCLMECR